MPLYHLDIRDGEDQAADVEGEEQPDLAAARSSALIAAKELLAIALKEGVSLKDALHRAIEIRVGAAVVDTIRFAEVDGAKT